MILVQDTFICKPGNASKLATLCKEMADAKKDQGYDIRVLTDMTGQYHRMIMTCTFESLASYEENMKKMAESPEEKKIMEKFKDMNDMYTSGGREIFKIW